MPSCDYCRGPITGAGHAGRPWPGRAAAAYCCFGCLSLGEQRQQEAAAPRPAELETRRSRHPPRHRDSRRRPVDDLRPRAQPPRRRPRAGPLASRRRCILCATLLVVALLGGPLIRDRVARTPPRAAHHRSAVPAHDDRRDGRVAASAPHRPREDLLRGRVGPARRLHAREGDRRAQPRRGPRRFARVGRATRDLPARRCAGPHANRAGDRRAARRRGRGAPGRDDRGGRRDPRRRSGSCRKRR